MTSLQDNINIIQDSLDDIKDAIIYKGGTISGDITYYATDILNIPGTPGFNREISSQGVFQIPSTSFTFRLPSNAIDVGDKVMFYAFRDCTSLTSADLSSLTTVSGEYAMDQAFSGCTSLTSIDLSSLITVSGNSALFYAFQNCTSLTSVDLSSLTTVSSSAGLSHIFQGCTNLVSADLSSLTTVSGNRGMSGVFYGCPLLTSVDLSSLTTVSGDYALSETFRGCSSLTSVDLSSLTTVSGDYALSETFRGCSSLTSVDLSSLTTVSGNYELCNTFSGCSSLASVDLSSLTTVSGGSGMQNTFVYCTSLTSIDLSSLVTVDALNGMIGIFYGCTNLVSVDLSSLTTVSGQDALHTAFYGCTSLTSVDLSSLSTINNYRTLYQAFANCTSLTSLSFPLLTPESFGSRTNQFNNMLQGVSGCTVHFPSNLQSVIGSWSDVVAGFGGTNTTVLFDLSSIRRAYTYVERIYDNDIEDYEDVEHTIYTDVDAGVLQTGDTMYYISNDSYLAKGTISAIDGDDITLSQQSNYVMGGQSSLTLKGITYDTYRIVVNLLGRVESGYTLDVIFYDSSNHEIDTITYSSSIAIPTSVTIANIPQGTSKVTATLTSTSGIYGRNIESIYNYFGGQTYTRDSSKDIIIN